MRAAVMAGVKKKTIFMIAGCALLLPLRLARAYLCHETVTGLGKSPPGSIPVSKEQRVDWQVSGVLVPAVARNGRDSRCFRQLGEKLFERYDLDSVESLSACPEEHHMRPGSRFACPRRSFLALDPDSRNLKRRGCASTMA